MSAHKNIFQTSDFISYTNILIALILEWLIPTNLNINKALSITIGVLLSILAWTIIFTAKFQFKKFNQKSGPANETTHLINTGIFKYSRNPIYLGVILFAPALGFVLNSIWLLVATIPMIFFIKKILVIPEEKYLLAKFGTEYSEYCKNVRRWF